jgi:DNA-binding transcriptional ArsR family regulator
MVGFGTRFRLDKPPAPVYTCTVTQLSNKDGNTIEHSSGCCPGIDELLEARFFKALCDPRRIGILVRLARSCGPQTVTQVSSCCPTDISVVSRHLATLRDAGMLQAEKRGKEVYYSVRYPELVSTLRAIADAIEACCPSERKVNHEQRTTSA